MVLQLNLVEVPNVAAGVPKYTTDPLSVFCVLLGLEMWVAAPNVWC